MADEDNKDTEEAKAEDKPATPPVATVPDIRWKIFGIVGVISLVLDQVTKIWSRSALADTVKGASCRIPQDLIPSIVGKGAGGKEVLYAKCHSEPVAFLGNFWHWKLDMNTGSAFGLFGTNPGAARIFLSVVGVLACAGMVYMVRKARADQRILQWALALVAGGAVGNLIDRIYFGAVTDMVSWDLGFMRWPTFNVADVWLVVGVGLMFIDIQKESKREKAEKAARKEARKKKAREAGLIKH